MVQVMGVNGYIIWKLEDFDKVDYEKICSYLGLILLDVYIDLEELLFLGMFQLGEKVKCQI